MSYAPTKVGLAVDCTVCGLRKAPRGRSVADVMASSLCNRDCEGYMQEPRPGSLWPNETDADFGFACSDDGTRPLTVQEAEQLTADYFAEREDL